MGTFIMTYTLSELLTMMTILMMILVFQNGSLVNPQSKAFTNDYELISIITNGNVEASQIGGDRGITSQMWKGNIAEVLIFDRAVNDDERKLI